MLGLKPIVLINQVSLFQAGPLREVPLYACSNSEVTTFARDILFGTRGTGHCYRFPPTMYTTMQFAELHELTLHTK